MPELNIWRGVGPKELLTHIASATGEEHDVIVYDTGYEFDPTSPDAVRFVASIAMTKATAVNISYIVERPKDGSVVRLPQMPYRASMRQSTLERQERESKSRYVYIPNADAYCVAVNRALNFQSPAFEDLSEEEQKELLRAERKKKRKDAIQSGILTFFVGYVPFAVAIGFALFGLFTIIYRLSLPY